MEEIFRLHQRCGEISRVIVEREFRGSGISRALMVEALHRSAERGVHRLFLECLKVHEGLYGEYGFRPISGAEGPVIDVYRTMIAMELPAAAARKAAATQSSVDEPRSISCKGPDTP